MDMENSIKAFKFFFFSPKLATTAKNGVGLRWIPLEYFKVFGGISTFQASLVDLSTLFASLKI